MEIQSNEYQENTQEYIKEIWGRIKEEVDLYRGVEDSDGKILSHNAYIHAYIGHNEYMTNITLRAKNDNRVLATYIISSLRPIGFVGRNGKLVKLILKNKMALSKNSVEKAVKILKEICDYSCVAKIGEMTWKYEEMPYMPNIIVCLGSKEDGGFDNVYIEIENIDAGVLEKFHKRQYEIHNSSIECKKDKITTIGWF